MGAREELASCLDDAVARIGVPGAVAGVLIGDETIIAASGVTSIEHPLPVDEKTYFQIGSITKTFTSAALMLLVEEGRLTLEDSVGQHLPGLAAATGLDTDAITIEHLLSHQAGFDGDHLWTHAVSDSLEPLKDARRMFDPGHGFSYNNAAFSLVGEIIERITGQPYASVIRDRLLVPLGMDHACFSADEVITHRVAAPHLILGDLKMVVRDLGWYPGWGLRGMDLPAGGLIASAEDLLPWCRFQSTGESPSGERLLELSSLERLHAPVVNGNATFDVGLDWFVRHPDGGTTIDHDGETVGYSSSLMVAPEARVGVVVLTHAAGGNAVNQEVRRWALKRFADVEERDPVPDPSIGVDVSKFTGRYLHPFDALVVRAGDEEGTISISAEMRDDIQWPPFPIHPSLTYRFFADDHVVSIDGNGPRSVVRFGFDGRGRADWLLYDFRRCPRVA